MNKMMSPSKILLRSALVLCACAVLHCGGAPASSDDPAAVSEPPVELALSPSNAQIAKGTAQQFSLRGSYADGRQRELLPMAAWRVVDEAGHEVKMPSDGFLQLDEPGRYLVSARFGERQLTTPIHVMDATVKSVAISPSLPRVAKGSSQQFTATASFSDGTTQDVTKLATWAIKDVTGSGVATIDTTGLLQAKSLGKATVTARYKSHSSSTTVEVVAAALSLLSISPAAPSIARGTSQRFSATATYSDGTTSDVTAAATWSVSDVTGSGVAAIDGTGTALGKAVGTAQVSADYGGLTAETTLTVTVAVPVSVAISPGSASIPKGTSQRFGAIATLSDGSTQDVTNQATWTAVDKSGSGVASIDLTGLAKGNAVGTATITCAYRGNSAAALLEVKSAVLTGIAVTPATLSLYASKSGQLTATGSYSDGSTQDLTLTATWTAADVTGTDVASVDAKGQVLGKSVGTAKITASAGGFSVSAVVTVNKPVATGLSVSPPIGFTIRGLPLSLTAIATLADGSTLDVSALATWKESDISGTGVATVDNRGTVNGVASGVAQITASYAGFSASSSVAVF